MAMPDRSAHAEALHHSREYLFHPERVEVAWGREPDVAHDPYAYSHTAAHWLANCAHLAYYGQAEARERLRARGWEWLDWLERQDVPAASTQGFLVRKDERVVCAFRGTEGDRVEDILRDADFLPVLHHPAERQHRGFTRALAEVQVRLMACLADLHRAGVTLYFTGHSLGAALATLAASEFSKQQGGHLGKAVVYTFGSPRVGNAAFAQRCDGAFTHYRLVLCCDLVTVVPPPLGYRHCGQEVFLDSNGAYLAFPTPGQRLRAGLEGLLRYQRERAMGDLAWRPLADHNMAYYAWVLGRLNTP